jgi:hypothetical protein
MKPAHMTWVMQMRDGGFVGEKREGYWRVACYKTEKGLRKDNPYVARYPDRYTVKLVAKDAVRKYERNINSAIDPVRLRKQLVAEQAVVDFATAVSAQLRKRKRLSIGQ